MRVHSKTSGYNLFCVSPCHKRMTSMWTNSQSDARQEEGKLYSNVCCLSHVTPTWLECDAHFKLYKQYAVMHIYSGSQEEQI